MEKKAKKKNKIMKYIKRAIGAIALGFKYACTGIGYVFIVSYIVVLIDKKKHPEKYEEKGE